MMAQNVIDSINHAGTTPPSVNTDLAAGVAEEVGKATGGVREEFRTGVAAVPSRWVKLATGMLVALGDVRGVGVDAFSFRSRTIGVRVIVGIGTGVAVAVGMGVGCTVATGAAVGVIVGDGVAV